MPSACIFASPPDAVLLGKSYPWVDVHPHHLTPCLDDPTLHLTCLLDWIHENLESDQPIPSSPVWELRGRSVTQSTVGTDGIAVITPSFHDATSCRQARGQCPLRHSFRKRQLKLSMNWESMNGKPPWVPSTVNNCPIWWARMDSNHQPNDYESFALPLSYGPWIR